MLWLGERSRQHGRKCYGLFKGEGPQYGDGTFVDPGPNTDGGASFPNAANIRWRHQRNTAANFLMGDGSVKSFHITTVLSNGTVKGELERKNIRPKAPNYYAND